MDQMTLDIPKKFEEILDKRGTGSSEFHTQTIVDLLREQNKSLLERLDSLTLSPAAADGGVRRVGVGLGWCGGSGGGRKRRCQGEL